MNIPPGTVVNYRDQLYTLVRQEPYRTKAGKIISLYVWQSNCFECGASFDSTTLAKPIEKTPYFTRRCPLHRSPGRIATKNTNKPFIVTTKPTVQAASLVGSASREALHTVKPLTPCDVCAYPEDCIAANSCSWKEC